MLLYKYTCLIPSEQPSPGPKPGVGQQGHDPPMRFQNSPKSAFPVAGCFTFNCNCTPF